MVFPHAELLQNLFVADVHQRLKAEGEWSMELRQFDTVKSPFLNAETMHGMGHYILW